MGAEYQVELPVFGIRTRFESNSSTVLERVLEAFGDWQIVADRSDLLSEERACVRIIVEDSELADRAEFRYRVSPDHRVFITTPASFAICDPLRRETIAYVTSTLVADRHKFRYGMIEAATLPVLSKLDRQPLHAAAISNDNVALLLAGPSGTGKSTLVYALAQSGHRVLSDDCVYVQSRPQARIWGMPRFLHLAADARRFFPTLEVSAATVMANGKTKIAVDLRAQGHAASYPAAAQVGVCLLERHGRAPELEPLGTDEVVQALTHNLESGFDLFAQTIEPALRQLATQGGWRLWLGDDPRAAIPLVQRMFAELGNG